MTSKAALRSEALRAIQELELEDNWDEFTPHLNYSGFRHRTGKNGKINGQLHFSALGTSPGRIEVRCGSMTIVTPVSRLEEAVSLCLEWLDNGGRQNE